MSKTLVLAEKPSVGREIAKVLGCNNTTRTAIFGDRYIVTWALGHLIELASPEIYDKRYKQWNMDDLPMIPGNMRLQVIPKTASQYKAVRDLMLRNDVKDIVIATDAGREGELVARWIIEKAKVNKPIKRLWISSQTKKAILDGFKNLKDGKLYDNLYKSAVCRAESDWIVGLNVTRALTCKHNAQLSAGRVQTPTLNMIVEREEEIRRFTPREYWTVFFMINGVKFQWEGKTNNSRIYDKNQLDNFIKKVNSTEGYVKACEKKIKKIPSPQAYDLTSLQIDANNKYGYGAKETLSILQRLYEHHKIVTYPRTDSKYISKDIVNTLDERLEAVAGVPSYRKHANLLRRNKLNITNRFVDDLKVSDHHAVLPTEETVVVNDLSNDERKIYDLIIKRFLAVISPDYEYQEMKIKIEINGEIFTSKFDTEINAGWRDIYEEEKGYSQSINYKTGDKVSVGKVQFSEEFTKPPSRYTEATLLKDMENPSKFVDDDEMKKTLTNTGGIGTVATRADIIEKLYSTFYIEKRDKNIYPTSKGKQLIKLVPEDFKSPQLTAEWEDRLNEIAKGKESQITFISEIKEYTKKVIETVKSEAVIFKHDNLTGEKCPDCEKYLLKVKTKKGEMLVCQDRDCGYRKSVNIQSNARCPQCHVKLYMFGEGEAKTFVCKKCGYKEKLSSWNKRKSEQGTKMSARDARKYLEKMNNKEEESFNNPFAQLLQGWDKNN